MLGGGSHGTVYSGFFELGNPDSRIVVKEATRGFEKADLYLRREVAINARLARVPSLSPYLAPYRGTFQAPSMQCDDSTTTTYIVWTSTGATVTLLEYLEPHRSSTSSSLMPPLGLPALADALGVPLRCVGWEVADQLSFALQTMHEAGVLHRDVKAENILVDPTSRSLRLIDLGSAADLRPSDDHHIPNPLEALETLLTSLPHADDLLGSKATPGAAQAKDRGDAGAAKPFGWYDHTPRSWFDGHYEIGVLPCSPLYMAPEATIHYATNPFAFDTYAVGVVLARLALYPLLDSRRGLERWTAQLRSAGNDLDQWLQGQLATAAPDEKLLKGLESVASDCYTDISSSGGGDDECATTSFGTAGWKMLRGLLLADPDRRLPLSAVRSSAAMDRALNGASPGFELRRSAVISGVDQGAS